ncbi:hypothetical protein ACFWB5_02430 [Corynebacterium xerosis]|uniref:hypothetical protein n=1 Tax=Corynebacterium xerosis TaxID=1725 RepID=UPI00364DDC47
MLQIEPEDIDPLQPVSMGRLKRILAVFEGVSTKELEIPNRMDAIRRISRTFSNASEQMHVVDEHTQDFTLLGLNMLLRELHSREMEYQAHRKKSLAASRGNTDFQDAKRKKEAVRRISILTGQPDRGIGPGSTERKDSLIDIARHFDFEIDHRLSKPEYGAKLAEWLGVPWGTECWSSGSTITLEGLNRILFGAARFFADEESRVDERSIAEERLAFHGVLAPRVQDTWDGMSAVTRMLDEGSTNWAQMEWIGFYFEHLAVPALINAGLSTGAYQVGTTKFDVRGKYIWDLKVHSNRSAANDSALLNDRYSIEACIQNYGSVGFIVLRGAAKLDDDARTFQMWHERLKVREGKKKGVTIPGSNSRRRKMEFTPEALDYVWLSGSESLDRLKGEGIFAVHHQGKNSNGKPRPDKYSLNLSALDAYGGTDRKLFSATADLA